jgi:hypothetical protein
MNKRQEKRRKGGRQERTKKSQTLINISDIDRKGLKKITAVGLSHGKKEKKEEEKGKKLVSKL